MDSLGWNLIYKVLDDFFFGLDQAFMTSVIPPPATPAVVEQLRDKVL